MSETVVLLVIAVVAYFVGAVPFGFLIGKARGIDLRTVGSKNIGATNAGRVMGMRFFWIVFLLDLLKGLIPVAIASAIIAGVEPASRTQNLHLAWIAVACAALLGHVFPVYLGFKGGKGVATGLGVIVGLWPYYTLPAGVALGAFVLIFLLRRIISLASVSAAVVFPWAFAGIGIARGWDVFGTLSPLLLSAVVLSSVVIWRHRENLARLQQGTESRIGQKPRT
jgi:acyl phosphate:glycerol-3-phosphate acyltransferase